MAERAVDLSFGTKPLGHIEGSAVEAITREVVEEWKRIDPVEVKNWKQSMRDHRERMLNDKGFTRSRDQLHSCNLPMYVAMAIGRRLGDPHWLQHDYKALEAVLRAFPEARVNTTTSQKLAGDQ